MFIIRIALCETSTTKEDKIDLIKATIEDPDCIVYHEYDKNRRVYIKEVNDASKYMIVYVEFEQISKVG